MERGTIRVFTMGGLRFGLKVIGTWDSWYRFKTPDGRKWRSIRAAHAHLQERARAELAARVAGLAGAWKCKVQIA